jgi:hypothetical protein
MNLAQSNLHKPCGVLAWPGRKFGGAILNPAITHKALDDDEEFERGELTKLVMGCVHNNNVVDIAMEVGASVRSVRKVIIRLHDQKIVERVGSYRPYLWRLCATSD